LDFLQFAFNVYAVSSFILKEIHANYFINIIIFDVMVPMISTVSSNYHYRLYLHVWQVEMIY